MKENNSPFMLFNRNKHINLLQDQSDRFIVNFIVLVFKELDLKNIYIIAINISIIFILLLLLFSLTNNNNNNDSGRLYFDDKNTIVLIKNKYVCACFVLFRCGANVNLFYQTTKK